ncbi:hypothetical protein B7P43_G13251 [Cryptotermes secundus]|uniref:Acyltransferase 3 domain-containing protein n=1 Tax=Cryptotermes secundus TaxID=105785 RepID=A0A2J7QPC5_9NEOP|nr:hypothetical protein B7P43_G13251 [Cryptotermes secundus]
MALDQLFALYKVLPALLVMIFFYATLFYKLGSGPRWDIVVGPERDYCQKNWWTNLLFINNYVNDERMCLLQSYFLACDMHFFIIAIPVVILLSKRPSIGAAVLGGIILVSIIIPFLVTYLDHKPALVNFYIDFLLAPRGNDVYQSVYIKSHTRASPYFVGLALGYLLYNHLNGKQKIGMVPSVVLCGCVVCLLYGTMMSGIVFYDPTRPYNPLEAGFFAGMHRFVWSLGISIFIVVITLGKLPVISSLLSSKLLLSLGSLSYCMFLIHPVFLYWSNGGLHHPEYFSYSRIVVLAAGDIVLSIFASLFLYLTIEAPCSHMTRKILSKKVATKQE